MKKDLQIFNSQEFGQVRIALINDEPVLNLSDVCFRLGYTKDAKGKTYLFKDRVENICQSLSIKGLYITYNDMTGLSINGDEMVITKDIDFDNTWINEEDFYDLCFESKAKHAKKFRKWVTSEILPTIRKTGGYVNNDDLFINTYLPFADDQTKALLKSTLEVVKRQNEVIQTLQPKANYFDDLVDRNLLTNIRDTAKELKIKQNDFTKWLEEKKYIYRDSKNKIKPYAEYTPSLFELKEFVTKGGYADTQTFVTPRGRETFRLLLKKDVA